MLKTTVLDDFCNLVWKYGDNVVETVLKSNSYDEAVLKISKYGFGKKFPEITYKSIKDLANQIEYINLSDSKIRIPKQSNKNSINSINSKLSKYKDIDETTLSDNEMGDKIETIVADAIRSKGIEIKNFQAEIKLINKNGTGISIGDIDVATNYQFIEVKKDNSARIEKLLKQLDKYVNPNNEHFFNFEKKEVIVYYNSPLDMSDPKTLNYIEQIKSNGIIVVNGLEELAEVLK